MNKRKNIMGGKTDNVKSRANVLSSKKDKVEKQENKEMLINEYIYSYAQIM